MPVDDVIHFIAQGAVNIAEGITTIEPGSRIHRAMEDFCFYVANGGIPGQTSAKPIAVYTYKVELANKVRRGGRAVGNLWGVGMYANGCRAGWALEPQDSEDRARKIAAEMTANNGRR